MYIMGYILKGRDEDGTEYLMHYGVNGMKWGNHLSSVLAEIQQAGKKGYKKIVSSVGNGNTIDNIKNTYKINKTKRAINKDAKAQTNAINGYGSERKTGQSLEQRGKSALNVSKQKVKTLTKQKVNNVKKEIDSRNKNDKVSSTIKSLIKNKKKK